MREGCDETTGTTTCGCYLEERYEAIGKDGKFRIL